MAPTLAKIEMQTSEIMKYIFFEEKDTDCRQIDAHLETDGPGSGEEPDLVLIADKLRTVADAMNNDVRCQAALKVLKGAVAQEAVNEAFSQGVDTFVQAQASQSAEVVPEMQLIKASVSFGLYVTKSCPELKNKVHSAVTAFINRRVGTWVNQQGGWDKVTDF